MNEGSKLFENNILIVRRCVILKEVIAMLSVVLIAAVSGCGDQNPAEITGETLDQHIEEILTEEKQIEDVFRGAGLPTSPNAEYIPDENNQCFVPVTDEAWDMVEELKEKTECIFTAEYAQENFYAEAFHEDYARYKEIDGKLCIDIGIGGALDKEWNLGSMEVLEETQQSITATVDYKNYDSVRTAVIVFEKTEQGLRINEMSDLQG